MEKRLQEESNEASSLKDSGGCLNLAQISELVNYRGDDPGKKAQLLHLRECKSCYGEFVGLMMTRHRSEIRSTSSSTIYIFNRPVNIVAFLSALAIFMSFFAFIYFKY